MASSNDKPSASEKDLPLHQQDHSKRAAEAAMEAFQSSEFGSHVEDLMNEWHVPGLAAAIVHDQTTRSRSWGSATLDPPRQCTPDTLFDIASSSKSMTAASVGLLVEDDEKYPDVKWDAVMSKLLPDDFVMSKDEYTQNVTVEDILSHRSGLPTHDASYLSIKAEYPDTPRSMTRNLRNLAIAAPLRIKFIYCNLLFTVATYLVEKLTGITFEEFLHKHFFEPLGMHSSHLQPDAVTKAGLGEQVALPYEWKDADNHFVELPPEQAPEAQGAGSIYTSVNDYVKYVKAMMNQEGPITRDLYLGLTRLRTFCNPEMDQTFDPFTSAEMYAVGWQTYWYRGKQIIKHEGLIAGFASAHFFMPELRFGGVILSNSEGGGSVMPVLLKELVDEFLQITQSERVNWNALQRASEERYRGELKEQGNQNRKELLVESHGIAQPQKIPLSRYVGEYWNAGYHGMKVHIKDDKLFIDAFDRSNSGLQMTFEHVCEQTQYVVHLRLAGSDEIEELKGEFRFDGNRVVRMGIHLETELDDLIWFDRIEG